MTQEAGIGEGPLGGVGCVEDRGESMSRRLLAGAIFAPAVVVVSATTVFFEINQSGETLGQRLTQASMRVNQLRAELNDQRAPAPRIEIARAPDADSAA